MGLWMFLLLLLLPSQLGNAPWNEGMCEPLPPPANVSISSFNMEHTLSFLPGPETPPDARFTVQIINFSWRRGTWKNVDSCSKLTAGQTCNLTSAFKSPFEHYQARVQAFTPTQNSSWTTTQRFKPQSDTVMGPPDVSLSGCGNCLIVRVDVPKQHQQLLGLYRQLHFHVQRTWDGVEFDLNLSYKEENMIMYLQPGVEYCVTVSVSIFFNSKSVPSKPFCAFTSPPPSSSLYVVYSLLGAFCVLGFLLIGLVLHGGRLSYELLGQRLPRSPPQSYIALQGQDRGSAPLELSDQTSAPQIHNRGSADHLHDPQSCPDTEEEQL